MKAYTKDICKTIVKGKKRFMALAIIAALGVCMMAGLKASCDDLRFSADDFYDKQNLFDIMVVSTMGLTEEDVEVLAEIEGIEEVEGAYSENLFTTVKGQTKQATVNVLSEKGINIPYVLEGEMPLHPDEIVVTRKYMNEAGAKIGDTLVLEEKIDEEETAHEEESATDEAENNAVENRFELDLEKENESEKENVFEEEDIKIEVEEEEEEPNFLITSYTIVGVVIDATDVNSQEGAVAFRANNTTDYTFFVLPEAVSHDIFTAAYITLKGTDELRCYSDEYEARIDEIVTILEEEIKVDREQARYDEVSSEAQEKVDEVESEEKIPEMFQLMRETTEKEIEALESQITQKEIEVSIREAAVHSYEKQKEFFGDFWTEEQEERLTEAKAAYEKSKTELETLQNQLEKAEARLADIDEQEKKAYAELDDARLELEEGRNELSEKRQELEDGRKELKKSQAELKDMEDDLEQGRAELEKGQAEYDKARSDVDNGWEQLEEGWEELSKAYDDIAEGKIELEEGQAEFEEGKQQYEDGVKEFLDRKEEALERIEEARQEIKDLKMTSWYISTRTALSGYSNVKTDAQCIESIGNAFPILFLTVAILISLTTISRMVEEDRGLIGTYKALGFTDKEIRSKYLIYALLACIMGGILGLILGFVAMPTVMFSVFTVMYQFTEFSLSFHPLYGFGGIGLFIFAIVGSAMLSCNSELFNMPATLMRPKAPKNGSRVLLERVTPIWSRLSFLNKVTARNLFRYKKRLFMTLFGIAGCTSLLLAGFTVKDTVKRLLPLQYGETFSFDVMVVSDDNEKLMEYLDDSQVRAYINPMINNVKMMSKDGREENVQLVVVPNDTSLRGYINLVDRNNNKVSLEDGMVFCTINIAEVQGHEEGDTVTIQNMNLENAEIEISCIVMNYLGNCIYMTENTYKELYDDYEANGAYIMLNSSVESHQEYTKGLGAKDGILSAMSVEEFIESFDSVFRIINLVITIIIVLAASLAFVVLFTLSTTNISERERELATIKVLGFFDREVHLYVNKETLILTTLGILLGLPLGKLFGMWLMSILKMPAIYFADYLAPISYLYAAIIAIIFAFIVNKITDKSLDKIDPVEALKSIE